MFSENQKISRRQLQALLLTDWMGETILVVPALIRSGTENSLLAAAVGIGTALAVAVLLLRILPQNEKSYYECVKTQIGTLPAMVLYLLYGVYYLLQTAMLLSVCGETAAVYLLPGMDRRLLLFLPFLTGAYLAQSGLEVRGRVSELMAGGITAVLFLMMLLPLFSMESTEFHPLQLENGTQFGKELFLTAASFGNLLSLPIIAGQVQWEKEEIKQQWRKTVVWPLAAAGILLLILLAAGFGTFGKAGMLRLRWPAVALMSSMKLPGIFLQRWDIPLLMLLMLSLFLAVGSGIFFLETILLTFWPGKYWMEKGRESEGAGGWRRKLLRKRKRKIALFLFLVLMGIILGAGTMEKVLWIYETIGLKVCVPLMMGLVFLAGIKTDRKRNTVVRWFAAAIGMLLLTGCTAKELEERKFPLVLEVDTNGEKLIFGCGWAFDSEMERNPEEEQSIPEAEDFTSGNKEMDREQEMVNTEKISRVTGESLKETLKNIQSSQEKYVDYSQVKAILWGKDLVKDSKLGEEVCEWLEGNPLIARNTLIFRGKTEDLSLETVQEYAQGQPGNYLENLYKNNAKFREYTMTLEEFLYKAN